MSYTSIQFKQNTLTAALLVVCASLFIWAIFNALVEPYPPYISAYQTTQTAATVVEPLDYHYTTQP